VAIRGETLRTFATLTTDANPPLSLIQERMPVIIQKRDWKVWLGEEDGHPGHPPRAQHGSSACSPCSLRVAPPPAVSPQDAAPLTRPAARRPA
jgi:putative SOS response-associated peptidase YedK